MPRSRSTLAGAASLVALGCVMLTGCSSDPASKPDRPTPTAFTAKDTACDRDRASDEAKNTIERVGGLATDDYRVRFSQSTRLGVVALVEGDTQKAYKDLVDTYGVAVVAQIKDDGTAKVTGFQQVQDLVSSICD